MSSEESLQENPNSLSYPQPSPVALPLLASLSKSSLFPSTSFIVPEFHLCQKSPGLWDCQVHHNVSVPSLPSPNLSFSFIICILWAAHHHFHSWPTAATEGTSKILKQTQMTTIGEKKNPIHYLKAYKALVFHLLHHNHSADVPSNFTSRYPPGCSCITTLSPKNEFTNARRWGLTLKTSFYFLSYLFLVTYSNGEQLRAGHWILTHRTFSKVA